MRKIILDYNKYQDNIYYKNILNVLKKGELNDKTSFMGKKSIRSIY